MKADTIFEVQPKNNHNVASKWDKIVSKYAKRLTFDA